jgi:hypothetical protein
MEKLFKSDNYSEPYHTITFPDFGFKTHFIFTYIYSQPISLLVLKKFL